MTSCKSSVLMVVSLQVGALPRMAAIARSSLEGSSPTTHFGFH